MNPCGSCITGGKCTIAGRYGGLHVILVKFGPKGTKTVGERHNMDHVTLLGSGSIELIETGEVFEAPAWINIPKEIRHTFVALTDNPLAFCVFRLQDADQQVETTKDPYSANLG